MLHRKIVLTNQNFYPTQILVKNNVINTEFDISDVMAELCLFTSWVSGYLRNHWSIYFWLDQTSYRCSYFWHQKQGTKPIQKYSLHFTKPNQNCNKVILIIKMLYYNETQCILSFVDQGTWWYKSIQYSCEQILLDTTQLYYYFFHKTPAMQTKRMRISFYLLSRGLYSVASF